LGKVKIHIELAQSYFWKRNSDGAGFSKFELSQFNPIFVKNGIELTQEERGES